MSITHLGSLHATLNVENFVWETFAVIIIITLIILASILGFYLTRYFILNAIKKLSDNTNSKWLKSIYHRRVIHRLVLLIPALIIHACAPIFAGIELPAIAMITKPLQIVTETCIAMIVAFAFSGFLNSVEDKYNQYKFSKQRPIKSYLQVVKILAFIITGLVIASLLLDKSLTYFLTGLSAMTAVIMLIFRDSILGFVASVQISAHDMIRLGDWIEAPNFGADGEVIDISLNTVKVKNFDNAIVMIPSNAFLSNSVKNWRVMNELGERRIKRVVYIDVATIKFCDLNFVNQLKVADIHIEKLASNPQIQSTNLTYLRLYLENYLSYRPDIHADKILVHELEALNTGKGLPLEVYAFTRCTAWSDYERTQAEIFEHIYAVLIMFDLKAVNI